ncbi:MAG: hypothetical protein RIR49_2031 [Actinomycetota bacterium]|jgi:hypothetical protein
MTRARFAPALDLAVLAAFIVLGRSEHDSTAAEGGSAIGGFVSTLAPFAIALGIAWAVPATRRDPLGSRGGLIVWLITLVGGLALRRALFGDGIAPAFIAVAAGFTLLGLVGWRTVAARL